MMKPKLSWLMRAFWRVWFGCLCWTIWTGAQTPNTPATAPASPLTTSAPLASSNRLADTLDLFSVTEANHVYLTFGLDRIRWLQYPFFGNPIWKYLASLIYLVMAFYVAKSLDFAVGVRLKKWAAQTQTKLDDLLIDLVHGPIKVISFVILLHIGLRIFSWPAWVQDYLSKGLQVAVAGSLTYVALKCIDLLLHYWQKRAAADADKSLNEQLYPLLRKSLKAFVLIVAILVTSQNLGVNITSILASLSIGGLALGLAAQDTLANLFGAIAVYIDKPFKIGDTIKLEGGIEGTVETIGLRSTRVRNPDGYLVTIPNKTMGNATITNVASRPTIKTEINLGLTYDTSVEQLKRGLAILDELYRHHPMTHDVTITFNKFAESALNIQVVHWWKATDYRAYLRGIQELNLAVKQRFAEAGLNLAYPTQILYLKRDSDKPGPAA
jgi:MscS family membrane protein